MRQKKAITRELQNRYQKARRKRNRYYDQEVLLSLSQLWQEADYICSKRLAPFLAEFIPVLEKHGEIKLTWI